MSSSLTKQAEIRWSFWREKIRFPAPHKVRTGLEIILSQIREPNAIVYVEGEEWAQTRAKSKKAYSKHLSRNTTSETSFHNETEKQQKRPHLPLVNPDKRLLRET